MDWPTARARFQFLTHAFEGTCGFRPTVKVINTPVYDDNGAQTGTTLTIALSGPTELVRYPRESDAKFAARNAVAIYENHHAAAVDRFCGFLGRRKPQRQGIDAPLVKLFVEDADLRGRSLDDVLQAFGQQAKARGSMLLVLDMPQSAPATSLADQISRRRVPYLRMARPETVKEFRLDAETGLFLRVVLCSTEYWDSEGGEIDVEREYTPDGWRITYKDKVLAEGKHPFGQCQVLAMTENGDEFPVIGSYAQIADLSRRVFNARSERDEILRSQTFSLLHMHVPEAMAAQWELVKDKVVATIGTNSMLVHSGDMPPGFIAPDSGPATTYKENIEELQQSIRRVAKEDSTDPGTQPESGVARRLRFEALNSEISTFARQLQSIEMRVWTMFKRAMSSGDVTVTWPTDYNLADVMAELDVLTAMQTTGFPPEVLNEKRKAVVAIEFDNADDDTKARLDKAIDDFEAPDPAVDPAADPNPPPQ